MSRYRIDCWSEADLRRVRSNGTGTTDPGLPTYSEWIEGVARKDARLRDLERGGWHLIKWEPLHDL